MKLTKMQHKYLLRAALVILLIAGSYMVLWASNKAQKENQTCTESMEDCSKKLDDKNSPGEMIWESLSRQFISASIGN